MFTPASGQQQPWLLIDTSRSNELRFASVTPSTHPIVSQVTSIPIDGLPTFTDALQRYERESGIPLKGRECVIGMAGAAQGEMLSMVRSRWTITRGGLAAVFGHPVHVLNDVASMAWATRSAGLRAESIRGIGQPTMTRTGRMAMILVEEGVGACAIDVSTEGRARILETESGHLDFAPSNEREDKLARTLKGANPFVSWERMLTLDPDDPAWRDACPELVTHERLRLQSAMLGRFVVNMIHAYGAWQGVMVTGSRAGRLLSNEHRAAFDSAFTAKRNFSRLLMGAPVWRADLREPVLTGAAEMMAQRYTAVLAAGRQAAA